MPLKSCLTSKLKTLSNKTSRMRWGIKVQHLLCLKILYLGLLLLKHFTGNLPFNIFFIIITFIHRVSLNEFPNTTSLLITQNYELIFALLALSKHRNNQTLMRNKGWKSWPASLLHRMSHNENRKLLCFSSCKAEIYNSIEWWVVTIFLMFL